MVGYAKLDDALAHPRDVQDPDSCPVRMVAPQTKSEIKAEVGTSKMGPKGWGE